MAENNLPPDNPSAFPEPYVNDPHLDISHEKGMSLRDYFAAKAMQAQVSNQERLKALSVAADLSGLESKDREPKIFKWIAESSYNLADAMLKQREL